LLENGIPHAVQRGRVPGVSATVTLALQNGHTRT
jgi:hypothetical protein